MTKFVRTVLVGLFALLISALTPAVPATSAQWFTPSVEALAAQGTETLQCPINVYVGQESFGPTKTGVQVAQRCCKVCKKGKACGNSCINRSYTCRQPPGCACDG